MHLHADDHGDPNAELRRLVDIHRAYEHLERSEELELEHDTAASGASARPPSPPAPACSR